MAKASRSVEFDKHKMTIRDLDVADNDVVSYFKDFENAPDLEDRVKNAIKTGVVALRTVGVVETVDYVEKEFKRFTGDVDERLEKAFGDNGEFSRLLAEHFGEDGQIIKTMFDPHREGTPLYELRAGIEKGFKDLLQAVSKQEGIDQVEAKTPKKGFKFEDQCEQTISEILRNQKHGDTLEKTGTKRGDMQGRIVGDFVISLGNGAGKIVVETKDVRSYALTKIQSELDEAMKNRNASYGIFVVKNVNSIDASNGYFHEYPGNKLVCALGSSEEDERIHSEILFIAYKWARLRLNLEHFKQQKKLDTSYVTERVGGIQNEVRDFAKILTKCGNIETSAEEIRVIAERMRRNIDREISSILESLEDSANGNGKQERVKVTLKK